MIGVGMEWCTDDAEEMNHILEEVLDRMELGLWFWYVDEERTVVNESWARIIGREGTALEELRLQEWLDLIHPDDIETSRRAMEALLSGKTRLFEAEYRILHAKGYYVWVLARAFVAGRDGSGRPILIAGAHRDITLRKQVEEIERLENETLRAVFDASLEGIVLANIKGDIVDCNESFLSLSGYSRDRALSLSIRDLESGDARAFDDDRIERLKKRGKDRFQAKFKRADGIPIDLDIGVSYLERGSGLIVASCRDISDRVRYEARLFELSTVDPLTGIFNRRQVLGRLNELLAKHVRSGSPISVAIFDIDHFKDVNDRYGHQAGDQALKDFASVLRAGVREYDIVGRFGGEEFLAILDGNDASQSAVIVDRIISTLRASVTVHNGVSIRFTASAGIACANELEQGSLTEESLLALADARLYCAKEGGRDRVVWKSFIGGGCERE